MGCFLPQKEAKKEPSPSVVDPKNVSFFMIGIVISIVTSMHNNQKLEILKLSDIIGLQHLL